MQYMRINHFTLKPGTKAEILQEVDKFLATNDPEKSGLLYILDYFDDTGKPSVGITVWNDKEKFEASGERWPSLMKSMEHLFDGEYRREEMEITTHNLPDK